LTAIDFVNVRANLLDATNILEEAALDRYAFVRDAYFQRRRNLVYDGNPPPLPPQRDGAAPAGLDTEVAREPAPLWPEPPAGTAGSRLQGVASIVEPKIPNNYQSVLAVDAARVAAAR
jgi:phospholipid-binding lipoprotein MlaA